MPPPPAHGAPAGPRWQRPHGTATTLRRGSPRTLPWGGHDRPPLPGRAAQLGPLHYLMGNTPRVRGNTPRLTPTDGPGLGRDRASSPRSRRRAPFSGAGALSGPRWPGDRGLLPGGGQTPPTHCPKLALLRLESLRSSEAGPADRLQGALLNSGRRSPPRAGRASLPEANLQSPFSGV